MIDEALQAVSHFSRETGIIDRDVDLTLEGLAAYPSRAYLWTPDSMDPFYYALEEADRMRWGRAIGVRERPRGIGVMSGFLHGGNDNGQ